MGICEHWGLEVEGGVVSVGFEGREREVVGGRRGRRRRMRMGRMGRGIFLGDGWMLFFTVGFFFLRGWVGEEREEGPGGGGRVWR